MFSRACTAFVSVLLLFVVATAAQSPTTITVPPLPSSTPASQCSPGPIQCCNSLQAANSIVPLPIAAILGLLGVVVSPVTALVGINCSPITLAALLNNQCTATPVCCTNNNVGGLLSVGCIPVTL
ncbi:hypothetical protein NLI96_g1815 [Meripilus lineatus]|uniref:Hydrophobin n=1 Tax=Meripilus lineatus TaxID=2056292 RepID=A0AAD5VBC9_9APHY|nr:hypothetical protein NLI96_g1815 [Physisporinus lineatus]